MVPLERQNLGKNWMLIGKEQQATSTLDLYSLPLAILVINREGRVQSYNEACKELLKEIKINMLWADIIKQNFQAFTHDEFILTHEGRPLTLKTQSHHSGEGQIIILIDETGVKQSFESKLQHNVKSLGRISATLAHQLKTPLSAALLYASNLKFADDKAKLQNLEEKIVKQLHQIKDLINDVLFLHKGDDLIEKIDVEPWIESVVKNYKEMHGEHKIRYEKDIKDKQLKMIGNRVALSGMLNNLIDNAIHASSIDSQVDIQLIQVEKKIKIIVKDYGYGMSESQIANAFKPFYTTKQQGTGLGLSIAQSVVQAHSGQIKFSSKINEFTEATIEFPLVSYE